MTTQPEDKLTEHEAIEAQFSDYYEKELDAADRAAVEEHLESCAECKKSYDEFVEAVRALSGLHKMSAPPDFEKEVKDTIKRRSDGRFFGRRAFGDRVPFEVLAIVALILIAAIYILMRSSDTGSFKPFESETVEPEIHEDAKDVVPKR